MLIMNIHYEYTFARKNICAKIVAMITNQAFKPLFYPMRKRMKL